MSRYDKQWEDFYDKLEIADAANFVVGATVYRAQSEHIEEGTITKVGRCKLLADSRYYLECSDGSRPYYVADFRRVRLYPGCKYPIEGGESGIEQTGTIQGKFFATRAEAQTELRRGIERRIEDLNRDVARWQAMAANVANL